APLQRHGERLVPGAGHAREVHRALAQIPLAVPMDLQAAVREMTVYVWHRSPQRGRRVLDGQGRRHDPETHLARLQPGLEVRQEHVEEVFLRLEEVAEVCAPGDVAHEADARLPERRRHLLDCTDESSASMGIGVRPHANRGFHLYRVPDRPNTLFHTSSPTGPSVLETEDVTVHVSRLVSVAVTALALGSSRPVPGQPTPPPRPELTEL